jgi:hypothetical protein
MTGAKDATLQALRLTYNAAFAAHQQCLRALSEARLAGTTPSAALLDRETKARQELERARECLLAAMTEAITGRPPGDAAAPSSSNVENSPSGAS